MKGINDVWNICIVNDITSRYLIEIVLIKGDNSCHDETTHYFGELRDVVCLKPPNGF